MVHDLHLSSHIIDVVAGNQLPSGDGLAGEEVVGVFVSDEVGNTELASAELAAEDVGGSEVGEGVAEDAADRLFGGVVGEVGGGGGGGRRRGGRGREDGDGGGGWGIGGGGGVGAGQATEGEVGGETVTVSHR